MRAMYVHINNFFAYVKARIPGYLVSEIFKLLNMKPLIYFFHCIIIFEWDMKLENLL